MPEIYNNFLDPFKPTIPVTKSEAFLTVDKDVDKSTIAYQLRINGQTRKYTGVDDKNQFNQARTFFKFAEHHLYELAQHFARKPSWRNIRARLKGLGARVVDIVKLQQILDELDEKLTKGSILQIYTDECWIPWEIVFDVRRKEFLAEKYILARASFQSNSPEQANDAVFKYSENLKKILNVVGNRTGCSSEAHNIFSDTLYIDKVITRNPLHRQYYCVAELLELIEKDADLVHFTCHGMTDVVGERYLQLGPQKVDHHLYSMMLETIDLGGKILFLNACSSIAPEDSIFSDVENLSSFGWLINRSGGGAVVGTIAPVSGKVSTRVASSFYSHFLLEGKTIGESLFEVRQELAKEHEPHGLMYSLFGDPHLRKTI